MQLQIYGRPGCTTVKKAVQWAQQAGLDPAYRHFSAIDDLEAALREWIAAAGIEAVFNERARTLKTMDADEQSRILASTESRIAAMLTDTRLIKRPVGIRSSTVRTGFAEADWAAAFG